MSGEAVATAAAAPGWFGKLPMLGDFASRRLPPAFVRSCDQWLSQGLRASQAQLGARWLDVYLTAPVWRFAWAPGVIDAQWWFGVMMPSVDAVGRYFPLLIAAERTAAPAGGDALDRLAAWYRDVGAAALATLGDKATLEALESALAAAPLCSAGDGDERVPSLVALATRQRVSTPDASSVRRWATALGMHASMHRYAGHSLWWPLQDGAGDDSLSVREGLPAATEFSLMLDGGW